MNNPEDLDIREEHGGLRGRLHLIRFLLKDPSEVFKFLVELHIPVPLERDQVLQSISELLVVYHQEDDYKNHKHGYANDKAFDPDFNSEDFDDIAG